MGDIGTAMPSIPAVGSSGTDYATDINTFLSETKARLEAEVPKTSLADGALDMNGSEVQNAIYLGLSNQGSAPSSPVRSLQSYDDNLYWINDAGAVQITSGTSLNTSLLGGITGDYGGSNPAQFRFVDADQEYYAYDDYAGGAWARVWGRNFDIASGATAATRVRLAYATAASYTLTFPAVPGSTVGLQMDSSGTVTASNTFSQAITSTDFKYSGGQVIMVHPASYRDVNGSHTYATGWWQLGNSTNAIHVPLTLRAGDRITGFNVYAAKASDATNTITARLERWDADDGGQTNISTATSSANAPGAISLGNSGLTEDVTSLTTYIIRLFQDDATPSAVDIFYSTTVTVTRP